MINTPNKEYYKYSKEITYTDGKTAIVYYNNVLAFYIYKWTCAIVPLMVKIGKWKDTYMFIFGRWGVMSGERPIEIYPKDELPNAITLCFLLKIFGLRFTWTLYAEDEEGEKDEENEEGEKDVNEENRENNETVGINETK